jgi:proline racemase
MSGSAAHRVSIIDSHTGGEPTRLVIAGGPDLGAGDLATRARRFATDFDGWRSAIVNEPRGSDVLVGGLLVEPETAGCAFGVIFFNNVGLLGMCGHGTIGLVRSLQHLGRVQPGVIRIDTPVGPVAATLAADGTVAIENVPSHRRATDVRLDVAGSGPVRGDVAWGGNWFFLAPSPIALDRSQIPALTDFTTRVRRAANAQGFPEVDHVELFGPGGEGANSRNFVLCPGGAYDRSPCGTGTSAKLACLAADGHLAEGEEWVQESIVGSRFRGRYRRDGDRVIPTITGTAHVTGEGGLWLDPADPFRWGIR